MTWKVLCGDARKLDLPDESVHCIILSPPYFGLRRYIDDPREIGRESTLDEWIANLVECAREWRRVLRADGTLWVNCGDAYNAGTSAKRQPGYGKHGYWRSPVIDRRIHAPQLKPKDLIGLPHTLAVALRDDGWFWRSSIVWAKGVDWLSGERQAQEDVRESLRLVRAEAEGSLFGLSRNLARALKKAERAVDRLVMSGAVMPESVTDRSTSAYEMLFMFSKSQRYFFDQEAIRVTGSSDSHGGGISGVHRKHTLGQCDRNTGLGRGMPAGLAGRNSRNVWVWRIGTESTGTFLLSDNTEISHFASFPTALAERIIKCGTSEHGCCASCGAPFVRVIEREFVPQPDVSLQRGIKGCPGQKPMDESSGWDGYPRGTTKKTTIAWHPTCTCHGRSYRGLVRCGKCRGSGWSRTSRERTAEHFPEDGRRESGKRGCVPNLDANSMIETGEPCPACDGTGQIEGDIWPDNVLAHWPRVPCTVLDPMAGSGTTGRAALNIGRLPILNDLKPEYIQLCRERLEAWPGDVPQKRRAIPVESLEEM